jgi:hypothetical protein
VSVSERRPGYGLFVWSDLEGRWCAFFRSEVRSRVERAREEFVFYLGAETFIVEASSVEPDDILAAAAALRPPVGAGFVDPAPGGVIEVAGELVELCDALWLEVSFQDWKSSTPFADRQDAGALDALRWFFVSSVLEARERASEVEFERVAHGAGGLSPVRH